MEASKLVSRKGEEEEWSSNDTGWTKYLASYGDEFGLARSYTNEGEGSEVVEDDDSLASDASSGPAYFEHSTNRSKIGEVKGHGNCWLEDETDDDHERQEPVKKKFCEKDKTKVKEIEKRRISSNYDSSKVRKTWRRILS